MHAAGGPASANELLVHLNVRCNIMSTVGGSVTMEVFETPCLRSCKTTR